MRGMVLIVEDEPLLGRNMRTFLQRQGFAAEHAETLEAGTRLYRELQPDLVLIDHNLPDGTGLSLVETIRAEDRWTKLVMITAHGGVELAVTAMRAGADDYLTKPVSLSEVSLLAGRLLEQARIEGSLAFYQSRDKARSGLDRIIGNSPSIVEMKRRIRFLTAAEAKASPTGSEAGPPVLILGETGTGKELVARALHFDGPRSSAPFIAVNCAALPDQLIESELFGHERGAFSGATDKHVGLFQAADGGTLFLDELGELPLALQGKLLKAIEDRVIRPVGSVRDRPINVRFVAATNAAIEQEAHTGTFRSDLLYRLNTVTIEIPPLRQRGDDILMIAGVLLTEYGRRYGREHLSLTEAARRTLLRHSWPGNIRQLRNVIEQAALLSARDQIDVVDLGIRELTPPIEIASPPADASKLEDVERTLIVEALRQHGGNVSVAAKALGISRDTLRYRMEKHNLRREYYI